MQTDAAGPPVVLDASALVAYLQREPGYAVVSAALEQGAVISAVNLAEVYARIVARGLDPAAVGQRLTALGLAVAPFLEADALRSALLYPQAQPHRLSLADRVCLALGAQLGVPVLTTDRAWLRVSAGAEIRLIR